MPPRTLRSPSRTWWARRIDRKAAEALKNSSSYPAVFLEDLIPCSRWRAMAEIGQPRFRSACASTSSPCLSMTGGSVWAGWRRNRLSRREPTRIGGPSGPTRRSRVGKFADHLWFGEIQKSSALTTTQRCPGCGQGSFSTSYSTTRAVVDTLLPPRMASTIRSRSRPRKAKLGNRQI